MSEIRINSIKIKNYRSFGKEQEFTFPNKDYKKPIAIVGYNNSGKTNLINCILFGIGNKFVQANTFELNDPHNLDYNNHLNIKINLEGSEFEHHYTDKNGNKQKMNKSITGNYEIFTEIDDNELKSGMQPSMFGMNKHYNIFYINFHNIKEEISTRKTSWGNLTSFLAKHIKKIVDTDSNMAEKQETYENEVKTATDKVLENSQLSAFIDKIKANYSTNLRNNSCEVVFGLPDYEDIFLQMIFKVGLNGESENLIPIDHFGDGYISMFVMAVIQAIAESNTDDKCLFLFEEPESFLHENHQEYFYKTVLCNLAERGHQVIYTTHSDRMVDIFDTKGIIRIEFDEQSKQTVIKYNNVGEFSPTMPTNINGQEIISFANFNSYIKSVEPNLNKILFSRKVVLVEGPNDVLAYKIAIEKEVEKAKRDKKYAETYLSFLNIAFVVHHGKATAYLLIELCKHFGLDYFVINDWDFDTDFIKELDAFLDENALKQGNLYLKDGTNDRSSNLKAMITTNWKLLKSAGIDKIHFNIPKLERVLGYQSDDKDSLGILSAVQTFTEYPETFLPAKLREFLELDKLTAQTTSVSKTENSELEDELPF
ncbi:ATP-dependent nuclease [Rhodoflexus caldus]|uniref:ATP-dependent nuclease n=1 Tax=Rhodoflexus caldus TaxID=2891236 RepID=UPI002029CF31|nr:AAA family ATPase [Rhodoflexus caldus]